MENWKTLMGVLAKVGIKLTEQEIKQIVVEQKSQTIDWVLREIIQKTAVKKLLNESFRKSEIISPLVLSPKNMSRVNDFHLPEIRDSQRGTMRNKVPTVKDHNIII